MENKKEIEDKKEIKIKKEMENIKEMQNKKEMICRIAGLLFEKGLGKRQGWKYQHPYGGG